MSAALYKWFILLLCPSTLLLGNFLALLLPTYFQTWQVNKDGWLNSIFVKNGWFWNSLVGWWCILRYGDFQINRRSLVRYTVLTVWWYAFTQALGFGVAPIMDLIFTHTGGHCDFNVFGANGDVNPDFHDSLARRLKALKRIFLLLQKSNLTQQQDMLDKSLTYVKCALNDGCQNRTSTPAELNTFINEQIIQQSTMSSSAQCRALGGDWVGGHDPSGHVFLITLMIMYSFGELRVFGGKALERLRKKNYKRLFVYWLKLFDNGVVWNVISEKPQTLKKWLMEIFLLPPLTVLRDLAKFGLEFLKIIVWQNPILLMIGLLIMWWWSFFVTTIVFHTFSEQLSGLLFAYVVAGILYWNDHWFIHTARN